MIEIEVEMDTDVLAAEAASNAVNFVIPLSWFCFNNFASDSLWEISSNFLYYSSRLLQLTAHVCRRVSLNKSSKLWSLKISKRHVLSSCISSFCQSVQIIVKQIFSKRK